MSTASRSSLQTVEPPPTPDAVGEGAKSTVEPRSAGRPEVPAAAPSAEAARSEEAGAGSTAEAFGAGIPLVAEPPAPLPGIPDLAELLVQRLDRIEARLGRIEASLINSPSERRSRLRSRLEDKDLLEEELTTVVTEINDLKAALETEDTEERRRRLGELRLQQAGILYRMGPDAPDGSFPPGETELAWT